MIKLPFMICALLLPLHAGAAIFVSEIAWMGSEESASHEWIELHTDSASAVSLEGWRLVARDGTPDISLSGSIAGNGYVLLERGEEAVGAIQADVVYTGALSNTGETLTLYDAEGSEVDRVVGGSGWSIGGDNESKFTAQYTGSSWSTGAPTPRDTNVGTEEESSSASEGTTGIAEPYEISHDAPFSFPATRTVFEGRVVTYRVEDDTDEIYTWSFGNGIQKRGQEVAYAYKEAGEYMLVISGEDHIVRSVISVVPVSVEIARIDAEALYIENTRAEEVDLSGWHLLQGTKKFTFPPHTYVLGESSVPVSHRITGFGLSPDVLLVYPDHMPAAELMSKEDPPVSRSVAAVAHAASEPEKEISEVSKEVQQPPSTYTAEEEDTIPWGIITLWSGFVLMAGISIVFLRRRHTEL